MRDEHLHGGTCHPRAKCTHHPGEKHFSHLCDGPSTTHPGCQFNQSTPQNTETPHPSA